MTQVAEKTQKSQPKSAQIKDAAFKWDDPLDLESELTEEKRMVRDTARDYAQEKLFPRVIAANRDGRPTRRSSARWASSGCWAPPFPRNTAAPASAMLLRTDRARAGAR